MKKKIALVTGGNTVESEISFKSAEAVRKHLDPKLFHVFTIVISPKSWYYEDGTGRHEVDKNHFSLHLNGEVICFDAVFMALHASPGEDGKLQGYLDMLGIPYTCSNVMASAITMNKACTKLLVASIDGLHLAKSIHLTQRSVFNAPSILEKLRLPVFIKPNFLGSSMGMSKVTNAEQLEHALSKAFREDCEVLVEELIQGREFTICLYRGKEGIRTLPIIEIISPQGFFDFDAKYTPGVAEEIAPAPISNEERQQAESIASTIYHQLGCKGIVRIDYFLEHKTGNFYFLEVNTIPGLTETSLVPKAVSAGGMTLQDLYTEILEVAMNGQ